MSAADIHHQIIEVYGTEAMIDRKVRKLDTFQRLKKCLASGFELIASNCKSFERGRIIGLKEVGWANRRIAHHMGRNNAVIRRCWQEWVDNGRFQCHDGRG
ncbi:HTH_Tnp_Tc3_2 domain-containing protein [Trichonephila clavipes]|nr:HTH_Tnp_Tc3_2 domain-containing protein [Trichonephila clavipes]